MSQRILLTRHGQTLENALCDLGEPRYDHLLPGIVNLDALQDYVLRVGKSIEDLEKFTKDVYDGLGEDEVHRTYLTKAGKIQAQILGEYLNEAQIIKPSEEVMFVTSELPRTHQTAQIIAGELGILLGDCNHYASGVFDEQDLVEHELQEGDGLEKIEKLVREGYRKAAELGKTMHGMLAMVGESNENKTIIAVLHANVNLALMDYILLNPHKDINNIGMGNCCLYELEREEGVLDIVESYLSNKEMEEALKNGLSSKN